MELQNFTFEIDGDGVALVVFDLPDRSMNVITAAVQRELGVLTDRIANDPTIRGAVLRSGKMNGFCAGADLIEMEGDIAAWRDAQTQKDLSAGVAAAGNYSMRLRALETCGKPVAAAIEGLALGGGLELALACHHRVVADDPKVRLGLPEATIGLMPGAGGTQRLPRIMGIIRALPHLLEGKPIPIDVALETNVVRAKAPVGRVVEACRDWILGAGEAVAPWDVKRFSLPGGGPHSAANYRSLPGAIATVAGNHPSVAHANILRAVYDGCQVPIDAGLRIEARYFFNTVRSAQAAAMVRTLFVARQANAKVGPPPYADALIDAAKKGWARSAEALVAEGMAPRLVAGIARGLGGWPVELVDNAETQPLIDMPDEATLQRSRSQLLSGAIEDAEAVLRNYKAQRSSEIDLLLLEAGYPLWAGRTSL